MWSNIRTPNNHHFPLGTNGKVVVLGVPILKHFRVLTMVVVVVALLFNVHGKHLRSCRDGQLT